MFCSCTFFIYWYPGRKLSSLNGSPRNFHTKLAWGTGRWPTFRNFNFLPLPPPKEKKNWREKTPKFRESEIHNFEMARHIDKRIADLSSTINGIKDGTKFGGIPNQFWCNLGRKSANYKFRTTIFEFCPLSQNFLLYGPYIQRIIFRPRSALPVAVIV